MARDDWALSAARRIGLAGRASSEARYGVDASTEMELEKDRDSEAFLSKPRESSGLQEHESDHWSKRELAMDAESKERARAYLAADIFLTVARVKGTESAHRLPKKTLRRARRFLTSVMANQIAKKAGARLPDP